MLLNWHLTVDLAYLILSNSKFEKYCMILNVNRITHRSRAYKSIAILARMGSICPFSKVGHFFHNQFALPLKGRYLRSWAITDRTPNLMILRLTIQLTIRIPADSNLRM